MRTVLLIGVGRFGLRIAMRLAEMKVEVMAVDKNEERVKAAVPYVTSGVVGDSTSEEFLKTIGVRNFDECVVAIGDDVLASIETTCQLKELGAKRIIARASKDIHERLLLRNGADEIVFPEKQMANWTALRCGTENIFDYLELNDEYAVFDVKVPDAWCGKSIGQLDIRRRFGLNIMAVKRGSDMEIAVGTDYVLEPGETMLVLGRQENVRKCFH